MKNILIISNYFPPEIGAASSRIFQLAKNLNTSSINAQVVCPFPNYPTGKIIGNYSGFYHKEIINQIKCHRLYIYPSNSSSPLKRLISMISFALSIWILLFKKSTYKYEKIIVQNSPLLVSFSSIVLFKKLLNKTIILNVSDLWPQSAVDLGVMKKDSVTHKIFKQIEKFNYKNSDKVICQSQYIINHVLTINKCPNFLYRNIPETKINISKTLKTNQTIGFIYAGLLGVAQGVLEIIKVLYKLDLDYKFDIYGDGNQKKEIQEFLNKNPTKKITFYGSISKANLQTKLSQYHYSFVPLVADIKGAFPSKIYELIIHQVPVIYIGEGEAKDFVISNNVGYHLNPNEINQLNFVMHEVFNNHVENYETLVFNCRNISKKHLSFNKQFLNFLNFLNE